MVVRFNGRADMRGDAFAWMMEEHRETQPLPEIVEDKQTVERKERQELAMQEAAEVYVKASFAQGAERTVLFAEANDRLLRCFLESGERTASVVREIEKMRDVMNTVMMARLEREKLERREGILSKEERVYISARILEDTTGLEESIKGMLGFIDAIRKKLPNAVLFTNHAFDALYGVDLLRIKGFQWNEETRTLEIDLVAYQAKAGNTTPQIRADLVKKYGEKFAALQRVAQVDIGQLGEMSHRPDVDLAERSTEELLSIAQGMGTNGLTDLQKFARRLRDVQNANTLAQATGGIQLLAPAARIRSVSGRFLGKNERGEPINESFENIAKAPLPPPPSQDYYEKRQRKNNFLNNKG